MNDRSLNKEIIINKKTFNFHKETEIIFSSLKIYLIMVLHYLLFRQVFIKTKEEIFEFIKILV